jgi:hypothetical protein
LPARRFRRILKTIAGRAELCHFNNVKIILSKPANGSTSANDEVRQLRATAKRIAGNKKSILHFLAATGMYTATGKLKPQFR